ncbi:MAG: phage tail tube protein, partial [Rickettsiales bacterium]
MAIASGSKHTLHYIAESTYGTTPATPTWTPICHSACTLGMTKDAIEDDCLNATRQVKGLRHGNRQTSGDINGRLAYGEYDDLLEAALMGTWTSDELKVGVVERSFTFERYFDVGTDEYHRFEGCKINTMSISVEPNANVGLTFGIVGQDLDSDNMTSQVASSTYSTASTSVPFDSFTGTITEGGSSIGVVTSLELNLDNGYESIFALMSTTGIEPTGGKSRLTGTCTVYYESKAQYEKFLNETSSAIVLTLTDTAGNDLSINLPNIKYTAGNPDVSG